MSIKLTENNRKWWILFAMTTAISMIFIDITVLPVALPTIQRDLGLSQLGMQWLINAYSLSLTVFLMAGGRMGDRYGGKVIFSWGLLIFSIGSILCGLSTHEGWFITSRAIQGLGGAMLIPSATAIIINTFPPHQRGKAMGLYISVGSIFLALGPFIGGVFTQYSTWRLIFAINIPIAIIGFLLTRYAVPKQVKRRRPFDMIGFITSSLGISAFIVGLMQTRQWGWLSPLTITFLLIGFFSIVILFKVDREVEDPYINFDLFKNKIFVGSTISVFLVQFILMVTVFWAIYFQNVLGFSPSKAGIISLLSNSPLLIVAPFGGHLLDKHGPRLPVTLGFILITMSLIWFLQILDQKDIGKLLTALIPFGCGIPLVLTPSFTTALSEVPAERRGLATGTISMLRQFGGTLGLAIIGSMFLNIQNAGFSEDLKRNTETFHMEPEKFQGILSKTPEALSTLEKLPAQSQHFVTQSFTNAYIDAFFWINLLAMVLASLGLLIVLFLVKKKTRPKIDI